MKKTIMCLLMAAILLVGSVAVASAEGEWQHFLLLGCDAREEGRYDRSDTMIVLSINLGTREIRIASILRDIWTELPGHGEGKINAAVVYGGPECAKEAVEKLLDIQISKYVLINMRGMISIIDLLGGLDVTISEEEMKYINEKLPETLEDVGSDAVIEPLTQAGTVHLNGTQVLCHIRNRKIGDDYARTERQRTVLMLMIEKATTDIKLDTLLGMVQEGLNYIETDMNLIEIAALVKLAFESGIGDIQMLQIPVEGSFRDATKEGMSCFTVDGEKNVKAYQEFLGIA